MQKSNVHELVAYSNRIVDKLLAADGDPELLDQLLLSIQKQIAERVDGYVYLIGTLTDQEKALRARSSEFTNAARVCKNTTERIKEFFKTTMEETKRHELVGDDFKLKLSPTKASLVLDETQIPEKFKKQTILIEPDKDKIRAALTQGEEVPGAELVENYALRKYVNKQTKKGGK